MGVGRYRGRPLIGQRFARIDLKYKVVSNAYQNELLTISTKPLLGWCGKLNDKLK